MCRKWIAWKLVQLAARLYDAEWLERISIRSPQGDVYEVEIIGDEYGCGVSSTAGFVWNLNDRDSSGENAQIEGWNFTWHDPVRFKEGLSE